MSAFDEKGLSTEFDLATTIAPEEKWLRKFLPTGNPIPTNFNKPSLGIGLLRSPLVEREDCVSQIKRHFDNRKQAYLTASDGRENYKTPVIVGIPGIGKSRLQNEYRRFFPEEQDNNMIVAVFVFYNNGHSVTEADSDLNINVTFAVRMLHRVFQENWVTDSIDFSAMMKQVKEEASFYSDLTVSMACKVIRAGLERMGRLKRGQRMDLYLAIDEFQAIPVDPDESTTKLGQLCQILLDASLELMKYDIHLYPIFAGVEWGKIENFGSSSPLLAKVTPRFLSLSGSLQIAAVLHPLGLNSEAFLECLMEIGDHPRLAVNFAMDASQAHSRERGDLLCLRASVLTDHGIGKFKGLSARDFLKIVAVSINSVPICPYDCSVIESLTWEQLANRGVCQISLDNRIEVSYAFLFVLFQQSIQNSLRDVSLCELYLWKALRKVIVDLPVASDLESWQKWERFGAYYHAIRINALLVLGEQKICLRQLFNGSSARASSELLDRVVYLRPALVFTAQRGLDPHCDLTSIGEKSNESHRVSALDPNICHVICNGTNGAGVDIWFTLSCSPDTAGDAFCLVADQRKLDCKPLTTMLLRQLDEGARRMVSPQQPFNSVVSVVCSAISSFGKKEVTIPSNCIAMTRSELEGYHGPLARCAAFVSRININTVSKTWIQRNLGCSKDQAKALNEKAKASPFYKLSAFMEAYRSLTSKYVPEEIRERLLLIDDMANGEAHENSDDSEDEEYCARFY